LTRSGHQTVQSEGGGGCQSGDGGDDVIKGKGGDDTIIGGATTVQSDDDTMIGGGGDDTFQFVSVFGHDTIKDFKAGAGTPDVIDIDDLAFADFNAVLAASTQVGDDVVITLNADNDITLNNVHLADLHQDDFTFF
jgi:Ca2+-binding RTX toxin-like protein